MNTKQESQKTILVFLVMFFMTVSMGCKLGQVFGPSLTPTYTVTYTPIFTFTPSSTFTPSPTFTPIPPTATNTPIPTLTPVSPTSTPQPYIIENEIFLADFQEKCNTEAIITDVVGSSFSIGGESVITMINGEWALWCYGAKHVWTGTLTYEGYTFYSDDNNPLQFMVDEIGYVYINGEGTVESPDGNIVQLPIIEQ